ncbi:hypothetical protein V7S43_003803 [Phytophthora oleae]|uniref:Uncharacterized protein n=1 Tax=Phytophthora oleae TaxID=2107226 RepID=A0ABD3FW05_9STRA
MSSRDSSTDAKLQSFLACGSQCRNALPAAGLTKSGNKRRVRRTQIELPLLRQHVQELELQLKRTQLQRLNVSPPHVQPQCNNSDHKTEEVGSLWNSLAERQWQERLRVEQQQLDLKGTYRELVDYSTELQRLFTKFKEIQEETLERVGRSQQHKFWDLVAHSDDDVFAEHMLVVAKLYLEIKQQYQDPFRAINVGSGLAMGRDIPRSDPGVKAGVVFEATCGVLLPFCLDVAAEAYWKFFKFDSIDVNTAAIKADNLDDIFSRSFTVRTNFKGATSEVRGKYMCQKYVYKGNIVLVWSGVWDVSEYGGMKFHGLQLHKRGYVKLRSVPHQGPQQHSTSTVVETKFETIPIYRGNVTDQAEQTQAFYVALNRSFNSTNEAFCQMMSDQLLKEDWKATFREENN